jgi:hypothetical protein
MNVLIIKTLVETANSKEKNNVADHLINYLKITEVWRKGFRFVTAVNGFILYGV